MAEKDAGEKLENDTKETTTKRDGKEDVSNNDRLLRRTEEMADEIVELAGKIEKFKGKLEKMAEKDAGEKLENDTKETTAKKDGKLDAEKDAKVTTAK
eukprot:CAMPEP_0194238130 /NCGR_PEP_ID=MMETSP0158-20130606/4958_1 /TAXON_ID=33649 /ORGANISM="Thalassionema nitzschioides, Strain L26-B" /LENGTH=97 /DNA_ID=CAMNT_0038972321 /DNA_START=17 /DNA_END=307 /DNA_ORIENTATION=+